MSRKKKATADTPEHRRRLRQRAMLRAAVGYAEALRQAGDSDFEDCGLVTLASAEDDLERAALAWALLEVER